MENPFSGHFSFVIRAAAKSMSQNLAKKLGKLEISITEAYALVTIMHNHGVTQRQLAQLLGMKAPNIANLLKNLSLSGYIETYKINGRCIQLKITRIGEIFATSVQEIIDMHEEYICSILCYKNKNTHDILSTLIFISDNCSRPKIH